MDLKLGGQLGYRLLRTICRSPAATRETEALPAAGHGAARLEQLFGPDVWRELASRRVLDVGCGQGAEAVAAAKHGAERVWGLDIQEPRLEAARELAQAEAVADRCVFLNPLESAAEMADLRGAIEVAYSIDSFEHYADAGSVLNQLQELLAPGGRLLISFGPPWKNPYGSHFRYLCRWPWIHLLFREETIMRVRAEYRNDGARRFGEVDGGLNQMTLARFERLVAESGLTVETLQPIPLSTRFLRGPRFWHPLLTNGLLREYFTSIVLCRLRKPNAVSVDLALDELLVATV